MQTLNRRDADALARATDGHLETDVPLERMSRWQIGGVAAGLLKPQTPEQVAVVLKLLDRANIPHVTIGDTSNLLFDSEGFHGVVLQVSAMMSGITRMDPSQGLIRVRGGHSTSDLAVELAHSALTGLEHIAGIPGTIGGLTVMNGGTQRKGVGAHVREVAGFDGHGSPFTWTAAECKFAYRSSSLQDSGCTVTSITLQLEHGDTEVSNVQIAEQLASRARRFPADLPNCGSTFVSDPALYEKLGAPGFAIEAAGLKGMVEGGAQVSPMHANFIVNTGSATSVDVLKLIARIRTKVYEISGIWMNCEARYISVDGATMPAHIAADNLYGMLSDTPRSRR